MSALLTGCGTYTTPAVVKLTDGTVLLGTTTAAASGGHFQLSTADNTLTCNGTYNAFDLKPTISIPVSCNDGRSATAVITRNPDGISGSGYVTTSDGQRGSVAFGENASNILHQHPLRIAKPSTYNSLYQSSYRMYYLGPRGGCYYINSNGNKTYVDRSNCRRN